MEIGVYGLVGIESIGEKYKRGVKRLYPDAEELIDESAPKELVEEMEITILVEYSSLRQKVMSIFRAFCFAH